MATIALYANRINQMLLLLNDFKSSVLNYQAELLNLNAQLLTISCSVCDVEDVIRSVQASTQTQEQKAASIDSIAQNNDDFIAEVVSTDNSVAALINQRKDDFYGTYTYLRPNHDMFWLEWATKGLVSSTVWCIKAWEDLWDWILGPSDVGYQTLEPEIIPDLCSPKPEPAETSGSVLPCGGVCKLFVNRSEEEYLAIYEEALKSDYSIVHVDVQSMTTSEYMRDLIKMQEASGVARLSRYLDANGHETIGYGHKLERGDEKYKLGELGTINLYEDTITEKMAEIILTNDLRHSEELLRERLTELNHTVSQREFDALISLVFNVGEYASIIPLNEELKTSKAADTLEWFINEGYRDKDYTMAVLGDMTSGGLSGVKKKRLDEIDILFLESQNFEEIYHYDKDIDRYGNIWNNVPEEYKAQIYITVKD